MRTLRGKGIVEGKAEGEVIVSRTPFGFFGGVNPKTGVVIDKWHELCGKSIKGKILVYPEGRGSTVGAAIILELARTGCAPAAVVNVNIETITAAGGILAKRFYDVNIPMVDSLTEEELFSLRDGDRLQVDGCTGEIKVL